MAVFADTVVYGLVVPFLPDILQERLGMKTSANGILFGCFGVGVLVGAPVSAYISDRWNIRKWPMILGLLALGATSVLFALSNAFWQLVLARLAQGISSGCTWAIGLAMVVDVYPGDALGKAMGIVFSGFMLGYLGGPVLGGAIYSSGGVHGVAIFVAAITVLDLIFRLLLREPREVNLVSSSRSHSSASIAQVQSEHLLESRTSEGVDAASSSLPIVMPATAAATAATASSASVASMSAGKASANEHTDPKDSGKISTSVGKLVEKANDDEAAAVAPARSARASGARRTTLWDLLKEWQILVCCVAAITVTGSSGAFEPTLPIHLAEKYHSSPSTIGLVFIAVVVPNVLIGPIAGRITNDERILRKIAPYGRFGFMLVFSVLSAIATACLGATKSLTTLIVNLVFIGFLSGFAAVPIMTTMGLHVGRMGGDAYAMVYALFNIAYSIGIIVIPTVLPPVMASIGFAGTMGIVSAILVSGAIILAIGPTYMLCKYGRAAFVGENAREFL
ncbi:hypothetical protein GGI12_004894 [Dipsacomyces acuminosporus]|nr:hypothetical protein GGI12_004894 [Dipsacomyces acuminosporus]